MMQIDYKIYSTKELISMHLWYVDFCVIAITTVHTYICSKIYMHSNVRCHGTRTKQKLAYVYNIHKFSLDYLD